MSFIRMTYCCWAHGASLQAITDMMPTFSSSQEVKMGFKMQNSPILPPFTPRSKIRTMSQTRGFSPMKQSRAVERFPPLKNPESWKDVIDEAYPPTTAPVITSVDQYKSFQSATVLRSVPIMRRHLDNFGGRTFSLPAKTKPYDPANRPMLLEDLTQNQRLRAEIAMVEKVRGLKRKREALGHRWGWRKFRLSGMEVARNERFNIQAEVQKLKELILPPTARDIYTGRGIRLPETHHTMRRGKMTSPEAPFAPPPSAWMPQDGSQKPNTTKGADTAPRMGTVRTNEMYPMRQSAPAFSNLEDLVVQSVPVPGIATSPAPGKPPVDGIKEPEEQSAPSPQPTPVMKMHEPVEQIEVVAPDQATTEYHDIKGNSASSPMVADTPVDRSRSMAAPSASPDGKMHNPLISISAHEDSITTQDELQALHQKFNELDSESKGHLTFEETMKVFPSELTQCQCRYLRGFYDIVTQSQIFGPDEFIAMTSLAQKIVDLSSPIQEMFEQINFATMEESITQYTELFGSVDRTGRGRIGVSALLQILSTTLQRQLEPDTKLALQIMETMQKEYAAEVPRLDFLSFIPYFLYLEEMT